MTQADIYVSSHAAIQELVTWLHKNSVFSS